jgi:hypothetical protein
MEVLFAQLLCVLQTEPREDVPSKLLFVSYTFLYL